MTERFAWRASSACSNPPLIKQLLQALLAIAQDRQTAYWEWLRQIYGSQNERTVGLAPGDAAREQYS